LGGGGIIKKAQGRNAETAFIFFFFKKFEFFFLEREGGRENEPLVCCRCRSIDFLQATKCQPIIFDDSPKSSRRIPLLRPFFSLLLHFYKIYTLSLCGLHCTPAPTTTVASSFRAAEAQEATDGRTFSSLFPSKLVSLCMEKHHLSGSFLEKNQMGRNLLGQCFPLFNKI
jgi:hypothetical protein